MIIRDELQLTEAVLAETGRADDPRFKEIVQALVRHLHDFAREVRLTEAEFDASISVVARLGQLTTPSHNEVRLMAGSLGLSTLVCLMNNGTEEKPTSANLLGPFWRQGSPVMSNGDSIVRSPTEGPPLFFTGTVLDTDGNPVAGAEIDVWHASPVGLYENQDPDQAEWNLRGRFVTDDDGAFAFRTVRPSGYPIPTSGPVGDLLAALKRHPFRPAHVHAMVYKPGYKTITSQIYSHDDPMLDTDAQFGVTGPLIASYVRHEGEPAPDPDVNEPWYTLDYTFVVEPGEAWLPTPPVSAKAETKALFQRAWRLAYGPRLESGRSCLEFVSVGVGLRLDVSAAPHARTRATLDTSGLTFAAFLVGVIVIVGGLIYFPMLILGPIGERIVG